MNHSQYLTQLSDESERRLIRQEIGQQMFFAPVIDFKRIAGKIATLFGRSNSEQTLSGARVSQA